MVGETKFGNQTKHGEVGLFSVGFGNRRVGRKATFLGTCLRLGFEKKAKNKRPAKFW